MGIQAAPEVKFALIREATLQDNNLLKISKMCEIAAVSRSGYYNWCASEGKRKIREDTDKKDFDLILEAYRFRGYNKGARGIHMRLLHIVSFVRSAKPILIAEWHGKWKPAQLQPMWSIGSSGVALGKYC